MKDSKMKMCIFIFIMFTMQIVLVMHSLLTNEIDSTISLIVNGAFWNEVETQIRYDFDIRWINWNSLNHLTIYESIRLSKIHFPNEYGRVDVDAHSCKSKINFWSHFNSTNINQTIIISWKHLLLRSSTVYTSQCAHNFRSTYYTKGWVTFFYKILQLQLLQLASFKHFYDFPKCKTVQSAFSCE